MTNKELKQLIQEEIKSLLHENIQSVEIGDIVTVKKEYGGGQGKVVGVNPDGNFATVLVKGMKKSYNVADLVKSKSSVQEMNGDAGVIKEVTNILEQAIPKAEAIAQRYDGSEVSKLAAQVGSLQGSIKMALGYIKG